MNRDEILPLLASLGVPEARRADMASQAEKRARQLAEQEGLSVEESLTRVSRMLREGWAGRAAPAAPRTTTSPEIKTWEIIGSKPMHDYKIFQTRADRVISPRTGQEHDAFVLNGPDWVNIIALTPDHQMVLVQQYRHGTRQVMWEIPGGIIDPGESPQQAGTRELLEETGYAGKSAGILGKVHPNPAFQTNLCYTVLITDARKMGEPVMEGMEDIAVRLVSEEEFGRMVSDGRIPHALVAVAELWRRSWRAGQLEPVSV